MQLYVLKSDHARSKWMSTPITFKIFLTEKPNGGSLKYHCIISQPDSEVNFDAKFCRSFF